MSADRPGSRTWVVVNGPAPEGVVRGGSAPRAAVAPHVEEKVVEALECLGKVDDLKTVAARIGTDADKIGLQAASAATTIRRLLTEAQTSLSGAVATDAGAGAA